MNVVPLGQMGVAAYRNVRTDHLITSTGGALCSMNAGGCIIFALHDPGQNNGCLAHFAPPTPEASAVQFMVTFLTRNGGNVANFTFLLAGGAGRQAQWQTAFTALLVQNGISVAIGSHDYRVAQPLGPLGAPGGAHWQQVAFHPATGNISGVPVGAAVPQAVTAGTAEYQINGAGAVNAVGGGWGRCFLTTACTEAMGLPDDCETLQTLRRFRDDHMMSLSEGPALIEEYYEKAPRILEAIRGHQDSERILHALYGIVSHCAVHIEHHQNDEALELYMRMVESLQSIEKFYDRFSHLPPRSIPALGSEELLRILSGRRRGA